MRTSLLVSFSSHNMLQLSSGIDEAGSINWKLALCLLFAWIMVYFCIWKGIRTTGKVSYVREEVKALCGATKSCICQVHGEICQESFFTF